MTDLDHEAARIAAILSDTAKADVRDGHCVMGGETCVCGSTVKGELVEYRLAGFPESLTAGCLLNRRGLRVSSILSQGGDV